MSKKLLQYTIAASLFCGSLIIFLVIGILILASARNPNSKKLEKLLADISNQNTILMETNDKLAKENKDCADAYISLGKSTTLIHKKLGVMLNKLNTKKPRIRKSKRFISNAKTKTRRQ